MKRLDSSRVVSGDATRAIYAISIILLSGAYPSVQLASTTSTKIVVVSSCGFFLVGKRSPSKEGNTDEATLNRLPRAKANLIHDAAQALIVLDENAIHFEPPSPSSCEARVLCNSCWRWLQRQLDSQAEYRVSDAPFPVF